MTSYRIASLMLTASLAFLPQSVFAQSGTGQEQHVPLQKTIGQGKPQVVPSLFVMNSSGVSLQGGKLT